MTVFCVALLGAAVVAPVTAPPVAAPVPVSPVAVAPAVTPAAVFQPQANVAFLRSGTPVAMKMAEALSTEKKKVRVGQRFQLEVAEAVVVNGQTVIPIGSPAIGEVTDVRNKGMWGKSGKLNARVLSVRVGDRTIRMTGQLDDKGTAGGIGAVAVSALVFLPAGFFMTGTSARIPMGAPVKGFIDEDVPLAFAATAPAPLTVQAAAPAMQVASAPVAATPAAATTPAVMTTGAIAPTPAAAPVATAPAVAPVAAKANK